MKKSEKLRKFRVHEISQIAYVTDGEHGSPDWDETTSIKYITAEFIKPNYILDGDYKTISEKQHKNNSRAALREKDILVYSVGAYAGYSAMAEPHLFPANIPRSVAIIRLNKNVEILPEFLTVFLNSSYGIFQSARLRAGNSQPVLALEKINQLFVPTLSDTFQLAIQKLYGEAYNKRQESKRLYAETEGLLFDELGLRDWQPTEENTAVKSFKESFLTSGRLDAEYYQPKYDELEEAIQNCKYEKQVLGNLIEPIKNGAEFRDFVETGIPYIRVGDVKNAKINLPNAKKVSPSDKTYTKDVSLKVGDILFTRKGSFGNSAVVAEKDIEAIISSEIMLLRLKVQFKTTILPQYLSLFLNSKFGFLQVERRVHGVAFYSIAQPDLAEVQIIIPPIQIQTNIVEKIIDSLVIEQESKRLLEVAKRGVEMAIEIDEQSALRFIDESFAVKSA